MATPQIPDFWPMALGASADTVEIPDTTPAGEGIPSFTSLFPILTQIDPTAGGVFIQRTWMNGLFQLLGNNIWYLQHGCLFPWNATFVYPVGAHVLSSDNNEYVAVQESTNQNPTLDTTGTYWRNRDARPPPPRRRAPWRPPALRACSPQTSKGFSCRRARRARRARMSRRGSRISLGT